MLWAAAIRLCSMRTGREPASLFEMQEEEQEGSCQMPHLVRAATDTMGTVVQPLAQTACSATRSSGTRLLVLVVRQAAL